MAGDIWSLLEMLLAVVLILFLAYWASRWVGGGGLNRLPWKASIPDASGFRVLGQISLGRDQRLLLVGLQNQCYLLGVTQQQISLLKELGPEASEALLQTGGGGSAGQADFLDVFKRRSENRKSVNPDD